MAGVGRAVIVEPSASLFRNGAVQVCEDGSDFFASPDNAYSGGRCITASCDVVTMRVHSSRPCIGENIPLFKSNMAYIILRSWVKELVPVPGEGICISGLCKYLKVSIAPIREALRGLKRDGYVIRNRKESYYVIQVDQKFLENLYQHVGVLLKSPPHQIPAFSHELNNFLAVPFNNKLQLHLYICSIYDYIQIACDNLFLSRQLEIFIVKKYHLRTAISNLDKELRPAIYKNILTDRCNINKYCEIIENICAKKENNALLIENSIPSYAADKDVARSKSCPVCADSAVPA